MTIGTGPLDPMLGGWGGQGWHVLPCASTPPGRTRRPRSATTRACSGTRGGRRGVVRWPERRRPAHHNGRNDRDEFEPAPRFRRALGSCSPGLPTYAATHPDRRQGPPWTDRC
jgi:hypothetical protein